MKVWGSTTLVRFPIPGQAAHNQQARVIVCACTQKRAIELLHETLGPLSLYAFRGWWGATENKTELAVAGGNEGVWYAPDDPRAGRAYKPMPKREEKR